MITQLLLFCALVAFTSGFRIVCYYTNWAQYRHGKGQFIPENIDPNLCTHIMYAFARPKDLTIEPYEWNDESTQWSEGMYSRVLKLKQRNPSLKILLAIGGYNMGTPPFLPIVDSDQSRAMFSQNVVSFLRQQGFDGLDFDWEYPGSGGGSPSDKPKLVLLMQELRRTFEADALSSGKPRLLLTGAFPAGKDTIDAGFDIVPLMRSMDFISIMTYDYHGSWEQHTGIHSPLYAFTGDVGKDALLNLDWTARYYLSMGADKDKMNLGLATYGRSFTLDYSDRHEVGSPARLPGDAGFFTGEKGFLSYYEICDLINSGANVVDVPSQRNRYLYKGNLWVGYDDVKSIIEKACYSKEHGFGGLMFWALDLDDFSGQTCRQGTFPLIRAAVQEMQIPSLANCAKPLPGSQVTVPTPTPTNSVITGSPAINPSNNFDCTNKENDFYPDPESCDHFYICANQVAFKSRCATGMLFSPDSKQCVPAYQTTCKH